MPSVEWDDENVRDESERVKFWAKTDKPERITVIEKAACMVWVHYIKKKGYVACLKDQLDRCPLCDHFGTQTRRQRFGTNVIWYETDRKGRLIEPVRFKIAFWTFGSDKFVALRQIKQEWGSLKEHDLIITCEDEQYQRFTMTPCKEAVWMQNAKLQKEILEAYQEEKVDGEKALAIYLTEDQCIELIEKITSGDEGENEKEKKTSSGRERRESGSRGSSGTSSGRSSSSRETSSGSSAPKNSDEDKVAGPQSTSEGEVDFEELLKDL